MMSAMTQTAFDRATATEPRGDGLHHAVCDPEWSAPRGPNGGYLAAIVLRAMQAEIADPERAPRSLTLHYLRPPASGPVDVDVTIERTGRSLSNLTARLTQDGRLCVLAVGAFGRDFPDVESWADPMPDVPRPPKLSTPKDEQLPPIARRMAVRHAIGPAPLSQGDEAHTGGWMAFTEPRPIDAAAIAMYTDAWLPAPFTRMATPVPVPTVDLTIHFRHRVPLASDDGSGMVLIDVQSRYAAEGFCEEDTLIWSPDGVLLAQSRQLAVLMP